MNPPPSPEIAPQQERRDPFLTDMMDLFGRVRAGHVDYWTYGSPKSPEDPVRGDEYWEKFATGHMDYYVPAGEAALIARFAADVSGQCEKASLLVDLGPGSIQAIEKKTLPFLSRLPNIGRYQVVDASTHFGDQAQLWATSRSLPASFSNQDFWAPLPNFDEPTLLLMMGGTISNLCPPEPSMAVDEMLAGALSIFRQCLRTEGWLLFVYDSNHDEQSLLRAYNHPYFHQFNFSVVHRALRDLPIEGLDPSALEAGLEWVSAQQVMKFFIEAKRSATFSMAGRPFQISAGQRFHIASSYKYGMETVCRALAKAGWRSAVQYQLLDSSMVLCMAHGAAGG